MSCLCFTRSSGFVTGGNEIFAHFPSNGDSWDFSPISMTIYLGEYFRGPGALLQFPVLE